MMATVGSASDGLTLWTTQQDFSVVASLNAGWNAGNASEQTLAPVATPDSDGSSTNGAANYTAPGATGTPGALSVQWGSGTFNFFYGPDLVAKTALRSYMGSQGLIQFDFTYPQVHVGTYFDLGTILNYDGHFQFFFGSTTATPNANGFYTTTVPYTGFVNSAVATYFQIGVTYSSDYSPLDPYYVDNFHLIGQGDFNEDGHVNASDIQAMESALANPSAYESQYGLSAANLVTIGDFNGDGKFNNADLQSFLSYLQAGNGSLSSVPEPASVLLLGLAVPAWVAAARRRRNAS